MAKEIERKFLVERLPEGYLDLPHVRIMQGYLVKKKGAVLRVRTSVDSRDQSAKGYVTVKGSGNLERDEFEMEIPFSLASVLLEDCASVLSKTRYFAPIEAHGHRSVCELDVFEGSLKNLVLAEVEIDHADQLIQIPDWFGREVTFEDGYANVALLYNGVPGSYEPPTNLFSDR